MSPNHPATQTMPSDAVVNPDCLIRFQSATNAYALPERFTYPFHYQAHPLCELAARELQQRLEQEGLMDHNFGISANSTSAVYGKMFGVLVVQDQTGQIGYLAAFSGKVAGVNHHTGFVPPVFDILEQDGFYRKEEAGLSDLNQQIDQLEQSFAWQELQQLLRAETEKSVQALAETKKQLDFARKARDQRRAMAESNEALALLESSLVEESKRDHFLLKDLKKDWKLRLEQIQAQYDQMHSEIRTLKEGRKAGSSALQQKIFEHYYFLNQSGLQKSLAEIFQFNSGTEPPAGAGECAAPKLLQYAFLHQLKPLAMAEFWWGESPVGEIRTHGHFYPACRSKCAPILAHMLEGMDVDPNPLSALDAASLSINILYEDDALLVIHKPASLLAVPGKEESDSVYLRIKRQYPEATGPLIVHRLDLATSGLMVLAKTAEVHKALQSQFLQRTIKKRYVADLEGIIVDDEGVIDLPLRVDLDDRPRQMVCHEYGKAARTFWKVVSRTDKSTRVHFFPITGRTHQLRVHAAHPKGLNMPIVGDDLYGNQADRLHLHAEYLEFTHPVSGERQTFQLDPEF